MEPMDQVNERLDCRGMKAAVLTTLFAISLLMMSDIASAREEEASDDPPAYVPQFAIRVKDGKNLATMTEKNEWFRSFRQTPFYQGLVGRLAPVIFAPADDFGSAKAAWQGRLIEYLYSKLVQNRPVSLHFYRRQDLSSPLVLTVHDLSKTELSLAANLISVLSSGNVKDFIFSDAGPVKVTALLVKQQKFAVAVRDKCLAIGRAPEAVASSVYVCSKAAPLKFDAEAEFSLRETFPALRGVSENFLGILPQAKMQLKWDAAKSRFAAQSATVELADHLLAKGKVSSEMLAAIPSDSLFFALGAIPLPKQGFSPEGLADYFKLSKVELRKVPSLQVAMAYVPIYTNQGTQHSTVLLLQSQKGKAATEKAVSQLVMSFSTQKPETFIRPICTDLIAITTDSKVFETFEAVCGKKRPAMAQMPAKWVESTRTDTVAGVAYLNPGKLFSMQIERGWKKSGNKGTAPVAVEIKQAREMAELLPAYFFVGSANANALTMKVME
jgi:hypothetical protein